MKLLMVLMGLEIGGAETHVVELAKELVRRGHTVHIASNGGVYEKEIAEAGIIHYTLPLHTKMPLSVSKAYSGLKKIIKNNNYDIIHAHARIPGLLCGILQKRYKFRFITSAHWVFYTNFVLNHITDWGERSVAVSNDIKKYLIDNYKYPSNKIDVTINGIDTRKFSKDIDWSDIKTEFNLGDDRFRIVYVSRMDVDRSAVAFNLLEIAPKLYEKYPNLEIVIVGGGNDFERLVSKVAETNKIIGKPIAIATGPRTDINKFVASGDMFVGVSRAALEAMSAEKPVIIAGNEGYIGLFDQSKIDVSIKTNFCCRGCEMPHNDTLFADVCKIADGNRDAMSKFNRQFILDNYSVDRMVNDYEDAYQKLLDKNPFRPNDVLISGYYGFKNTGDDSLLKAIVDNLKQQKENITITVLSKTPKETAALYGVKSINRFDFIKICCLLKKTRLLISGGGSLLQDATSTKSYLYYSTLIKLALKFKTKVMIYANGIGPLTNPKNRADCKQLLEKTDVITLRDSDSMQELVNMGLEKDVTVTADPAFSLRSNEIQSDNNYFIVSVRKWKKLPADFHTTIAEICKDVKQKHNLTPVFVPMQRKLDMELCKNIAELCDGKVESDFANIGDMLGYFKNSKFVLGMRLHALIYSLSMGVPVVPLSYDPKIDAIVKEWGCKDFSAQNFDKQDLLSQIDEVVFNRDNLSQKITKTTKTMKEKTVLDAKTATELLKF